MQNDQNALHSIQRASLEAALIFNDRQMETGVNTEYMGKRAVLTVS